MARKREEDARLTIECRRSKGGGLEVVFTYVPEFQNYAVGVSMSLAQPSDARVYKGKIVKREGAEGYVAYEVVMDGLGQNVRYNAVSLLRTEEPSFAPDTHRGAMFIEYPDERNGPFKATVKIDVLIHGNYRISSKSFALSAIDDEYYSVGGPIAVLVGKSRGL